MRSNWPLVHGGRLGQTACKDVPGCLAVRLSGQPHDGALAGSVKSDKEMAFAFFCSDLGKIDVEIANRVSLERPPFGLVPIPIGASREQKAAMRRRPRQVRDRWLKGMQTVIQGQRRVPPVCHTHRGLVCARHA